MNKPVFTSVCTALITPFLDDKINYPLAIQLLRRQINAGVRAVVLAGTTGEAPTLSDREKLELFKRCKEDCAEECTIIAGTGSNSTEHTVELSQAAEEAGADALLVVSPYYNKANSDGLIAHYVRVAHAVTIPVILYNVPSRTGVDIPISVYRRLSAIPNIAGVKEASADITKQIRTLNACDGNFCVWAGNDEQIVPSMSIGSSGVISVLSNLYPAETVAMTEAALAGDFDTAAALQGEFMDLIDLLFSDINPIPVKYAMNYFGYDCGDCRLPLAKPNKALIEKLHNYLS